nr:hypothetical protein [Tanacetum cinerariifolium]
MIRALSGCSIRLEDFARWKKGAGAHRNVKVGCRSNLVTTSAGNAPGKSSYANITCKPSGKKVNVRTLFTPEGNRIDVVVPVDSILFSWERRRDTLLFLTIFIDGLDAMLENGPWFIRNNPLILKKWQPTENILKEDVSIVSVWVKLYGVPVTAFSEPSQTSRGVPVGLKMGFKPHKKYRHVPKKSTASSSGNKKKDKEHTIKVDNSSSGTTPIIEKIKKFEYLLTIGQAILVDKDDNPLKKVEFSEEDDSEDEVASVDNDMARSMTYERGFGTQSLLEQWRDSYGNGDYDDDPYDDDMYEGHDLSHELQAICDNLDIRVRGCKKK